MNWFRKPRTAAEIADSLIVVLDFLAFFALATTGEISLWVFALAAGIAIVRNITQLRLPDSVMVGLLLSTILVAVGLGFKVRMQPVIVAAHATPLFHAFLWFARNQERFRSWRVGIGFIGLVLASALTPEFHIFALIILFIVLCSLAVSSVFLDNTLRTRAPALAKRPLPSGFIRYSIALSAIIFLSSLVIFPLLPRAQLGTGMGLGRSDIGYKEDVNISDWARFREGGQDHVVLRLYLPESLQGLKGVPFALLRGKVLELFNGKDWLGAVKTTEEVVHNLDGEDKNTIEVISEPLASSVLLLPYGASEVKPLSSFLSLRRLTSGEWTKPLIDSKRLHYRFAWNPLPKNYFGAKDLPRDIHRRLVDYPARDKVEALSHKIVRADANDLAKVQAVSRYFSQSGFVGSLSEEGENGQDPLDSFLFKTKRGHCELFASAAALILRHLGVPTRVVVGFRLTREPSGAVLVVNNTEAHAWAEAYTKERGWIIVDATPSLEGLRHDYFAWVRNGYDAMSSYWYRYILSFDAEAQFDMRKNLSQSFSRDRQMPSLGQFINAGWLRNGTLILFILVTVTLVSWVLYRIAQIYWFGSSQKQVWDRETKLRRERKRFEKLRSKLGGVALEPMAKAWQESYERHRFGREFAATFAVNELREQRLRFRTMARGE